MNQTKLESLIEACINVGIGFFVSIIANFVIFPIVGVSASGGQILWIGLFMTVISVARSYIVRRWAERYLRSVKNCVISFLRKEVK